MPTLLLGKHIVEQHIPTLREHASAFSLRHGYAPKLIIIQIGDEKQSTLYIARKVAFAASVGVETLLQQYAANTPIETICADIRMWNQDAHVQGIMMQLPIPHPEHTRSILDCIDPIKDVDGLTSWNTQQLFDNTHAFIPATTKGIITLLRAHNITLAGAHIAIISDSQLVGRPTALALLNEKATITICHKYTQDLATITRAANIIITGAGHPNLIGTNHVREGQVIVDIGISFTPEGKVVGDVDFDAVAAIIGEKGYITPVPGGVGPLTVMSLIENVLSADESTKKRIAAF